jgi:hypothetical protein
MTKGNIRDSGSAVAEISEARSTATYISSRVKRERVQIRRGFVESSAPPSVPPLTQLLRGGRGGEVKIKLLLSMIWVAAKAPYDVTFPARSWATLLALPDPGGKGAARITDALRTLEQQGFVSMKKHRGQPSSITLLSELGTGESYSHPGDVWQKLDPSDTRSRRAAPRYMQLSVSLWTNGWIAALSGPALSMLLILLTSARGRDPENLWFSQSVAATRYGLTEPTRRKGIDELAQYGLVTLQRAVIAGSPLSTNRHRNVYTVNVDRFETLPERSEAVGTANWTKNYRRVPFDPTSEERASTASAD